MQRTGGARWDERSNSNERVQCPRRAPSVRVFSSTNQWCTQGPWIVFQGVLGSSPGATFVGFLLLVTSRLSGFEKRISPRLAGDICRPVESLRLEPMDLPLDVMRLPHTVHLRSHRLRAATTGRVLQLLRSGCCCCYKPTKITSRPLQTALSRRLGDSSHRFSAHSSSAPRAASDGVRLHLSAMILLTSAVPDSVHPPPPGSRRKRPEPPQAKRCPKPLQPLLPRCLDQF